MKITGRAILASILAGSALILGACDVRAQDKPATPAGLDPDATYPGCVSIFDGKSFDGWEANPSTWSIIDGAMRGVGGSSRLAYTKADYGSFRLIFTARMNPVNGDHLGVLFWGDRPKDSAKPKIDNAGWIQFMPPHGAMWDYHPPKHHNLPHETLAKGARDFTKWYTTELLCNLDKGTMRAAVDGVEIARYTHPTPGERTDPEKRIIAGPIGMFRHGGGASEYKSIYVENNPQEDKLRTVALGGEADWQKLESAHLRDIRQVTRDFVRAGEGYFSPDGKLIIFQAEEKGANPFYQQFVMDLGTGQARRVSTGVGKTTCGYFSPDGKKIIFASSHFDPQAAKHYAPEIELRAEEAKSKKRRRYQWDFDPYMTILEANPDGSGLKRLTHAPGYHAEGSYAPDGKSIVFCSNRDGANNLELYIMSADGSNVRQLTHAPGCYNGGPFFSPDGKKVIFRSDRNKKDHLQLYVINADGTGEKALTNNDNWVYWAPFWHPDGKHIIYTAADHSDPAQRPNYDLYWMNLATGKQTRLTFAPGADVLPVFSPGADRIMWTSTRGDDRSSQLWVANFVTPRED